MPNTNMRPTTGSTRAVRSSDPVSLEDPTYLQPADLDLNLGGKITTICGNKLNTQATPTGMKITVVGGIISIDQTFYAMTSARSLSNATLPYEVQFKSNKLDWALCKVTRTLAVPNTYYHDPLLRYMPEEELEHTGGPVNILVALGRSYEAQLLRDPRTTLSDFDPDVKMRTLVTTLANETKIPTGAWVVQGDSLCGYVVHCQPDPAGVNGRLGHMIPIWQAFKEMEAETGKKVVFGQQLHNLMART